MSKDDFTYIEISDDQIYAIGNQAKETRIYHFRGSDLTFRNWLHNLEVEFQGNLVPSTWVPDFVGVSRAAVHKRIKARRLTMFVFELEEMVLSARLKRVPKHRKDFAYCVRSECQAWRDEIAWREARKGPPELLN